MLMVSYWLKSMMFSVENGRISSVRKNYSNKMNSLNERVGLQVIDRHVFISAF